MTLDTMQNFKVTIHGVTLEEYDQIRGLGLAPLMTYEGRLVEVAEDQIPVLLADFIVVHLGPDSTVAKWLNDESAHSFPYDYGDAVLSWPATRKARIMEWLAKCALSKDYDMGNCDDIVAQPTPEYAADFFTEFPKLLEFFQGTPEEVKTVDFFD